MLVTGGAGFIGSHLVDALLERGDRVTVLDRLSAGGSLANLAQHDGDPRLTFVQGDVRDAALVERLVGRCRRRRARGRRDPRRPQHRRAGGVPRHERARHAGRCSTPCRAHGTRMLMISTDEVYGAGRPDGRALRRGRAAAPAQPVRGEQGRRRPALRRVRSATYGAARRRRCGARTRSAPARSSAWCRRSR